MQTSISQYVRGFTLFLLALLGISIMAFFLLSSREPVTAQIEAIKPGGDLYTVSQTIGQKEEIAPNPDIKFIYDRQNGKILYGKGLGNQPGGETEFIGGTELWLTDENGTFEQNIVSGFETRQAFFGSNGVIFYLTRQQDLYFIPAGQTSAKKILEKISDPAISTDGKKLVYQKLNRDWTVGSYFDQALGLHVFSLATGNEVQISKRWEDFAPLWVPTGNKIFFFSTGSEGLASLFVMDEYGSGKTQLTNTGQKTVTDATVPIPSEKPTFSTDGRTLSYQSDGKNWIIEFDSTYSKVIQAKPVSALR